MLDFLSTSPAPELLWAVVFACGMLILGNAAEGYEKKERLISAGIAAYSAAMFAFVTACTLLLWLLRFLKLM